MSGRGRRTKLIERAMVVVDVREKEIQCNQLKRVRSLFVFYPKNQFEDILLIVSNKKMYEGSDNVKESKKDILKQNFEKFCQVNNENIAFQYLRYVQLVDKLTVAGVKLENQDTFKKFQRSLPQVWNIYFINSRRTENLRTLKLGELFGILNAYQIEIDFQQEAKPSSSAPSRSTKLYASIHNSIFQGY
ncbi:hypothetical protein R6Q57_001832 [Mikania cordata]